MSGCDLTDPMQSIVPRAVPHVSACLLVKSLYFSAYFKTFYRLVIL